MPKLTQYEALRLVCGHAEEVRAWAASEGLDGPEVVAQLERLRDSRASQAAGISAAARDNTAKVRVIVAALQAQDGPICCSSAREVLGGVRAGVSASKASAVLRRGVELGLLSVSTAAQAGDGYQAGAKLYSLA